MTGGLRGRLQRAAAALVGRDRAPQPAPLANGDLLAGRRALVTGSGRNIGKAIAWEMARQGAALVLHDRCPDTLHAAAAEGAALGFQVTPVLADISVPREVDALAAAVRGSGGCDILVHNAAFIVPHDHPEPLDDGLWRSVFDTNVHGPVRLTRQITDALIERRAPGAVIFVTSMHAHITYGAPAYSTSKAAITMLVEELAVALAPHHIRVNGLAPGYVAPEAAGGPVPHGLGLLYHSSIPAEFIARAAMMLAAETFSAHTTGTTLVVDAGVSRLSYLTAAGHRRWPSMLRRG